MKRVTGIGGVFFKSTDPQKTKEWYAKHLGFGMEQYGTSFEWGKLDAPEEKGSTVWSPFKQDTKYMDPSKKEFMINYRVENLEWLVEELKKEGVTICDAIDASEYGKFVHIMDNDGNKIELWEAPIEKI
ncbi:MAG TPA: VOC family protein [Bacteroidia bacterium]|jgi:predicted enzyme related to lactoylglutathione lyase|nr:VOC family protein [Bacteroidia bacterium]